MLYTAQDTSLDLSLYNYIIILVEYARNGHFDPPTDGQCTNGMLGFEILLRCGRTTLAS